MTIHHLNCGTMCPFGGRLIDGEGSLFSAGHMVCHCLLIETSDGLVLVDSGLGLEDVREPARRLGRGFTFMTRPRFDLEETAVRQVVRLGFKPADVRHIVVTHLDLDHAGGLADFPEAAVHLFDREHDAAMAPRGLKERERYRAVQWAHAPRWVLHPLAGEHWMGFESVRAIAGTPEVLLVPVTGHTRGHSAVAVRDGDGWLLHCGDAYFNRGEMDENPSCPAGLRVFQSLMAIDDRARRANQIRLRELAREKKGQVRLFSAHDPVELTAFQAASTQTAAKAS